MQDQRGRWQMCLLHVPALTHTKIYTHRHSHTTVLYRGGARLLTWGKPLPTALFAERSWI